MYVGAEDFFYPPLMDAKNHITDSRELLLH